jgi:hypothetical protein
MGTLFASAQIVPTCAAVQVGKIYFDEPCKYCRDRRRATTNIRPVDHIGRPMADLNVVHAARGAVGPEGAIQETASQAGLNAQCANSHLDVGRQFFASYPLRGSQLWLKSTMPASLP